jgi:hypothetical protein
MTLLNRLPNDLQPCAPCGSQYNQFHAASLSKRLKPSSFCHVTLSCRDLHIRFR